MSELRKDPVTGRWVIISTDRRKRPSDFRLESVIPGPNDSCPFCEGREEMTPRELLAHRNGSAPNGPGWSLRVVPNQFPVLRVEGTLDRQGEGLFDKMNGIGAHEVIIECPFHEVSLANLSEDNIRDVLWVYHDRLVDLKKDPRLVYGMVFKNVGAAAGASLEHTHSQLIVTPIVPISVLEEMTGALEFFNYRDRCIFCDMIYQELSSEKRIVLETPNFVVFAPYASRFPFETWILPKNHASHYENIQKKEVDELGTVLKLVLLKLESALDKPAYNNISHTSPFETQQLPHFHWHIEVIPRLTRVAGFEWGTGFYINPTPPEEAAQFPREVSVP